MIGTHNSFTYLPVRKWWMKPIKWGAKCQAVDIQEQYLTYGSRLFDLRVKFKKGKPVICHGIIEFESDNLEDYLYWLDFRGDVYCRVILEFNIKPDNLEYQTKEFNLFCSYLEIKFPNIKFFGGNRKWDWLRIYQFKNEDPSLDDKYSSTDDIKYINDIWPWLYAKLHNKENIANGTDKDFLFVDFINIQ